MRLGIISGPLTGHDFFTRHTREPRIWTGDVLNTYYNRRRGPWPIDRHIFQMLQYLISPSLRSSRKQKPTTILFSFSLCSHLVAAVGSASPPGSGTYSDRKSAQHTVADARDLPQHMPDTTYEYYLSTPTAIPKTAWMVPLLGR